MAVQSRPSPSGSRTSPSGTTRTPSQLTHQSNDSSKQTESSLTLPTRKRSQRRPCRSLACLVAELRDFLADTPIGMYRTATGTNQVSNRDILEAVRQGVIRDNLNRSRYDYSLTGTHSLRSGGATRLCLEGFNKDVIHLMGWWSSDTYLKYIQH
jgi:hypothetical protein